MKKPIATGWPNSKGSVTIAILNLMLVVMLVLFSYTKIIKQLVEINNQLKQIQQQQQVYLSILYYLKNHLPTSDEQEYCGRVNEYRFCYQAIMEVITVQIESPIPAIMTINYDENTKQLTELIIEVDK